MNGRRPIAEPYLFGPVAQPRAVKPEPKILFADVLFLRRCGALLSMTLPRPHPPGIFVDRRAAVA